MTEGKDDPLIVLYAGYVFDEREGLDIFFRGLRLFDEQAASHRKVRVEYLGPNPEHFLASAERNGVREAVVSRGRVSLDDSRRAMTRADVLLLITASGARGYPEARCMNTRLRAPRVGRAWWGRFRFQLVHMKGSGPPHEPPATWLRSFKPRHRKTLSRSHGNSGSNVWTDTRGRRVPVHCRAC